MWFSGSEGQRLPVNPIVKKYHGQQCLQVINRQGRYNRSRGRYGIEDVIRWQYRSNVGRYGIEDVIRRRYSSRYQEEWDRRHNKVAVQQKVSGRMD